MPAEGEVLANTYPLPRLQLQHGRGCELWDTDGNNYLDFISGLGVCAFGHGDAVFARLAAQQMLQLAHGSNLFSSRPSLELGAALLAAAPFAHRVWLCSSGAESVEAALKFSRLLGRARGGPRKHVWVSFTGSFHGRTFGALAVTHTASYREPFEPGLPGVRFVPFNDLEAAAEAIDADVCGVLVEPVQGEGGVHLATPAFLQGLRALCDQRGAALICDEVQCGLGRTGRMFACEHAAVVPDILCLAKPLGGGLPIGATLLGRQVAELVQPGQHGSTFGGNPVACAVGTEVMRRLQVPSMLEQVQARGAALQAALRGLLGKTFVGWRGVGLMQALVLAPGTDQAAVVQAARHRGLLVSRGGKDAIRLLPPLICETAHIERAVHILAGL
ncbi:MAG: aspartate aminotransferase family protein [Acetobacteraceae bacterium]|nr:MAG: aspartate aminotransferase family protein [Acetobacteraceae bacterium]